MSLIVKQQADGEQTVEEVEPKTEETITKIENTVEKTTIEKKEEDNV